MKIFFLLISIILSIVTNSSGQAIAGLTIYIRSSSSSTPLASATTTSSGAAEFNLPNGNYIIYIIRDEQQRSIGGTSDLIKPINSTQSGFALLNSFITSYYTIQGNPRSYSINYLLPVAIALDGKTKNVSVNGSTNMNGDVGVASSGPMRYLSNSSAQNRVDILSVKATGEEKFRFALVFKTATTSEANQIKSNLSLDANSYGVMVK